MKFLDTLKNPVLIKRQTNPILNHSGSESASMTSSPSSGIPTTPTSNSTSAESSFGTNQKSFQEVPLEVFQASKPFHTLLKAQSSREYYEWSYNEDEVQNENDTLWYVSDGERKERIKKLILIGSRVTVEHDDSTIFTLNLIDTKSTRSNMQLYSDRIQVNDPNISLICTNANELVILENLIALSIFEHFSIYKSLTGTVISSLGLRMPDMHLILNSQFNFKDWCEIYIEGRGWVKAWCHINKKSKMTDNYEPKGKYQIKFYKDNKSADTSVKANLLCYIPDVDYIQDIILYNPSQGPESNVSMFLNELNSIKILGDVRFPESTVPKKKMFSPKRSVSTGSVKLDSFETDHKGLLIRPIAHHGLLHLEALIKFVIPMMDVTRKYGRPSHFKTSREDKESLMFGLPRLPNTEYFKNETIASFITELQQPDSNDLQCFAMASISEYLHNQMQTSS